MHAILKIANIIFNFTGVLSLTCNNTACGGIREPNAVAFSNYYIIGERSEPPLSVELSEFSLYLYIYIYIYIYINYI